MIFVFVKIMIAGLELALTGNQSVHAKQGNIGWKWEVYTWAIGVFVNNLCAVGNRMALALILIQKV